MHTYNKLKIDSKQFLAVTGFTTEAFGELLVFFESEWTNYITHFTLEGKVRRRPPRAYKDAIFPDVGTKLVFILQYLKNNPLQQTHAAAYGMNQPQANLWIHLLMNILRKTLEKQHCLPCRDVDALNKILTSGQEIFLDGSERPIPRPGDNDVQKEFYSGKKTSRGKKSNH